MPSESDEFVDDTMVQQASVQTLCPDLGMRVGFIAQNDVVRFYGRKMRKMPT